MNERRRHSFWFIRWQDLNWPNHDSMERIKRKAEGYAKANITTAMIYGCHFRWDYLPYFTILHDYLATVSQELDKYGIELIIPSFAGTTLDTPTLSPKIFSIFTAENADVFIDAGGDDAGAVALGRFSPFINEEDNFEMIFVVNFFRPLTRTAEEALTIMREVEAVSHLKFTSIMNNSNLGDDTTAEDIISTQAELRRLSEISGLPVLYTSAKKDIAIALEEKIDNIFPLSLQNKII